MTETSPDRVAQLYELINRYHEDLYEIVDSTERSNMLRLLKGYMEEYVSSVPHHIKFRTLRVEGVLTQTFLSRCKDFDPRQAAAAFENLAKYGQNLLEEPWRKDFARINMISGYFVHNIQQHLQNPSEILIAMTYVLVDDDALELNATPSPPLLKRVVMDCLMASQECLVVSKTLEFIKHVTKSDVVTAAEVYQYRRENAGDCVSIGQKIYANLKTRLRDEEMKLQVLSLHQDRQNQNRVDENFTLSNPHNIPEFQMNDIDDMSPEKEKKIAQEVLKNTEKQQQLQLHYSTGSFGSSNNTSHSSHEKMDTLESSGNDKEQNYHVSQNSPNIIVKNSSCSAYFPFQAKSQDDRLTRSNGNESPPKYPTSSTNQHPYGNLHQGALQKCKVSQDECQAILSKKSDDKMVDIPGLLDEPKNGSKENISSESKRADRLPSTSSNAASEFEANKYRSKTDDFEKGDITRKYGTLNIPPRRSLSSKDYKMRGSATLDRMKYPENNIDLPSSLVGESSSRTFETEYQRNYAALAAPSSKNQSSKTNFKSGSGNLEEQIKKKIDECENAKSSNKISNEKENVGASSTKVHNRFTENTTAELKWTCPHCTYNNYTLDTICEVCCKSRDFATDSSPPKRNLGGYNITSNTETKRSYSNAVKEGCSPNIVQNIKSDNKSKDDNDGGVYTQNSKTTRCPHCTFDNPKFISFCSMCSMPIH